MSGVQYTDVHAERADPDAVFREGRQQLELPVEFSKSPRYLQVMPAIKSKPRKAVQDYMDLPEGTLAELIEGEIFRSPSPRARHQRIVLNLAVQLRDFAGRTGAGEVFVAPFDLHLPSQDVVQPDVVFVSSGRKEIVRDWIYGVPDLLIEVLSPESPERDAIVKRNLYAKAGVPEYWIVDGDVKAIQVLRLAGDRYEPEGYFRENEILRSVVLKELAVPLAKIFA